MQSLYPLDGGYAVKLTTAKWYTPVGRSIQKERKLMPDGRFVEVYPDSLPEDSLRKLRPEYKSDAGRTVYGGGAITPDLVVQPDTLTTAEQDLAKLTSKFPEAYQVSRPRYDQKGKFARLRGHAVVAHEVYRPGMPQLPWTADVRRARYIEPSRASRRAYPFGDAAVAEWLSA